jgi:hypothetical protein
MRVEMEMENGKWKMENGKWKEKRERDREMDR